MERKSKKKEKKGEEVAAEEVTRGDLRRKAATMRGPGVIPGNGIS